jgi:hypothetical protein
MAWVDRCDSAECLETLLGCGMIKLSVRAMCCTAIAIAVPCCSSSGSNATIDASANSIDAALACGAATQVCCSNQDCNSGLTCISGVCETTPTACVAGGPPWLFVSEVAPATTVAPYEAITLSATFRNCTGASVPRVDPTAAAGIKLGFSAPRDYDTFGVTRVALPTDVANNATVTFSATLRAPPLTGTHAFRWALVDEGKAWLPSQTNAHTITVRATSQLATICPGLQADIGGEQAAAIALQSCIDATPNGGVLALPAGIYRMDKSIIINKPMTLTTAGSTPGLPGCWANNSPACAVLRADANLSTPRGFVFVSSPSSVHLDRIVIDGNRAARLASTAAATCASGTNGAGFNAHSDNCADCSFKRGVSARALCGSGWEWTGGNATVEDNLFYQNGDHNASYMWSDGLTLLFSDGAIVRNNHFVDNSDIDFISGGATNATFQNNQVLHALQGTYGGIMLDNFNGGTPGKFQGTMVSGNVINCGNLLCDFGIELGPHPWYPSANIEGGTVMGNTVVGAKIQINAEGAGTAAAPMVVTGNTVGASPANARFGCNQNRGATAFNVSPDSFVTTTDSTARFVFHDCP